MAAGGSSTFPILLFLLAVLLCSLPRESTGQKFRCTANSTCRSLIGYKSLNDTTLAEIRDFFDVKNLRTLLGSNGLPESTRPDYRVAANRVIRVPVPCVCFNGTGVSNKVPVYKVQPGDGLFVIASSVFMGLVTFQQIAAVNRIPDPNLIEVGQELWVPLPCSCEEVDGERVVHYTHVVVGGSTVEGIAAEFGTTNTTLYRLNGIESDAQLKEGDSFDVPLKACNSSIRSDSGDSQLLLSNGTYAFTAHNCVRCNCDSSNNWTLRCQPSGVKPSDWPTCPAMQCGSDNNVVMLGNSTGSDCGGATCSYAGFSSNQTIFTSLDSTCPAAPSGSPPNGNFGGRISPKNWNMGLFGLVHLVLLKLCKHL